MESGERLGDRMPYQLRKTVVIVGMMGSGKTAVGRVLADRVGAGFVDSDQEIEMSANLSISQIFERFGERFFRDRESAVLKRILDGPVIVLSTGGGTFMSEENRGMISARAVSVWLKADVDLIWSRVMDKATRPLLQVDDPVGRIAELLREREGTYSKADLTVETSGNQTVAQTTDLVLRSVRERSDALEFRHG